MNNFKNVLDQGQFSWVPFVCFGVFLLISLGLGFFKGWKKALYYLGWDIVALLVAVFATKSLLQTALKDVHTENMPVDLKEFIFEHKALMPIVMSAWFVIIKPIATLVSLPFKAGLKANTESKHQLANRFWGAGISFLGALPVTTLSANGFTLISGKNFFSPVSDALVTAATFGVYDGISNYVTDLKNTLELASNSKMQDQISDFISGDPNKFGQISDADRQAISDIVNGKNFIMVLENAAGTLKKALEDIGTNGINAVNDQGSNKIEIASDQWNSISSILQNQFRWSINSVKNLKDGFVTIKN